MTAKQLLSEISLRCGDPNHKDFDKSVYERAIYRCNRDIAKYYEVFQKILRFTLRDMVEELTGDIIIEIPEFKAEYLVDVNGYPLVKVDHKIEPGFRGVYYLEFREGRLYFNYTLGLEGAPGVNITGRDITTVMSNDIFERIEEGETTSPNKSMTDNITICYKIIPDLDTEIGEWDIPTKYEEEQIDRAVYYMAKLGTINYPGENEKAQKYDKLIKLYKSEKLSDYDKMVAKDSEWTKIQPWSVI